MSGLENYRALIVRVDEMCRSTAEKFAANLSCRPGCDACCRHLSIFAVEAAALREALEGLPQEEAELVRHLARESTPDGACPLLHHGLCLLYDARPIICRTHGLPLLVKRGADSAVDFCPENFRGVPSIPGSAVINLERLNEILAAVNALFLQESPGQERISIAEALCK